MYRVLACIILTSISRLLGQSKAIELADAEDLFVSGRFAEACPCYQYFLGKDTSNPDLNYKMGVCYLNSRSQKKKALEYFKKATLSTGKEFTGQVIVYKLLADAAYIASDFDLAIKSYRKCSEILLSAQVLDSSALKEINLRTEMCKMGIELKEMKKAFASLVKNKIPNKVNNTGPPGPSNLSASGSFPNFTLGNSSRMNKPGIDKEYFEEYNILNKTGSTLPLKRQDTSGMINEATIAASVDGQIILIYRNDNGNANLYASCLNGNEWMAPEKLDKIINTSGWEPNEYISSDGNTLYFTSDREGGFGRNDIYKSVKLPTGTWSKAINLGPAINTPYDDEAPFIHPDGVTLYFSSNRFKSRGGFDIFTSSLTDSGTWTTAISVGYPSNRKREDLYNSSEKYKINDSAFQKEKISDPKNNYIVTFNNQKKTPLTLVKGKVLDRDGKIPGGLKITVVNNETGEIAGLYHTNRKTGQYIFIVPPGQNANMVFEAEGYLFHSENIDVSKEINCYIPCKTIRLNALAPGSKDVLNNIFFDKNKSALLPTSQVELTKLLELFNLNPKLVVEISVCLDKVSTIDTIRLANDKIQTMINYFSERGVAKERLIAKVYKKKIRTGRKTGSEQNVDGIPLNKMGITIIKIK